MQCSWLNKTVKFKHKSIGQDALIKILVQRFIGAVFLKILKIQ